MNETLDRLERASLFSNLLEAGECTVQKKFRVVIREICRNNSIEEGDQVIIYVKKKRENKI